MLGIFASVTVKPKHMEEFLSTIRETAYRSVTEEAGCVRFDVFRDQGNENRYVLYEVYVDEAAFDAHLETDHVKRTLAGSKTWAETPFEVTRADSIYPEQREAFAVISGKG